MPLYFFWVFRTRSSISVDVARIVELSGSVTLRAEATGSLGTETLLLSDNDTAGSNFDASLRAITGVIDIAATYVP